MRFVIIPTSPPLLPSFRDCGERSTADPLLSLSLSLLSRRAIYNRLPRLRTAKGERPAAKGRN